MTEEEMMEGPLPPWAIDRARGKPVLGAQLPTRDGRRCGNAHIVDIAEPGEGEWSMGQPVYHLLTDAGSEMRMTFSEMREQFYPPVWVSDVNAVWRKFGPRPEPAESSLCCERARASNGWHHNEDCHNWVLVY